MQFHKKIFLAMLLVSLMMVGLASAQTVTVVTGDGLLLRPSAGASTLTVLVRNAQGQPQPGAVVTWALSGQGAINFTQTTTDSTGQASILYTAQIVFSANFTQSVVTASALGASANMNITTSGSDQSNVDNTFVSVQLLAPILGDVISGAAGSTSTTAVRAQIFANGLTGLQAVPNILVRLVSGSTTGSTISCSGTTGYSDINGNLNCLPVFGGQPGTGQFTIDVGGGYRIFGPFNFTVTQGQLAAFRITGGNNQSGNAGAILPVPLQAHAEDAAGNGFANVPVVWEPVVPNTVTILNASTASDLNGNVSATVQLGSSPGAVLVRLRNQAGTASVLYTLQVNLSVTGLSKLSGDNQDAIINTTFAQPLVVQVNSAQGATSGIQVQFTGSGVGFPGSGGLVTTDAQGRATISVQAGANPGAAVVTASVGGFVLTFNLTIRLPGPQITSSSFFNGAGGQPGGVSPASLLAIYGGGLATGLQGCVTANQVLGPLPLLLSNVTIQFVGGAYSGFAPLYAVCNLGPGQEYVVLQVPAELPVGSTSVTVRVGTGSTTLDGIPVTPVSPGIFETVMSDGRKRAVLIHSDGSYVTLQNPAHAGERLRGFVTGLGRPRSRTGVLIGTNQSGIPGDDASPFFTIRAGVNNEGVRVVSVIYAQDLIGVYELTFEIQSNAPTGDINFAIGAEINDVLVFGNGSKVPIQ